MESSITAGSTAPKIRRNNGRQKISPPAVIVKEITITVRKICLAALFAPLSSPFPRQWEHMIAAPVASAANTWITSVLIESTSETADIATLPTLLTIMVSAIPIREFNICSTMIGISSIHNSFVENMRLSQSIFVASYSLFFIFLSFLSKMILYRHTKRPTTRG